MLLRVSIKGIGLEIHVCPGFWVKSSRRWGTKARRGLNSSAPLLRALLRNTEGRKGPAFNTKSLNIPRMVLDIELTPRLIVTSTSSLTLFSTIPRPLARSPHPHPHPYPPASKSSKFPVPFQNDICIILTSIDLTFHPFHSCLLYLHLITSISFVLRL